MKLPARVCHESAMRTALLTLCAFGLAGCPDPAKDKTKATVTPAKEAVVADVAPLANAVRYPFSQADSKVGFVGAKVTGKHEGGFKTFAGVLEVVEGDVTKSRVRADLDVASLFTDSAKLDGHLKSPDFFAADQFPQARFLSSSFQKLDGNRVDVTGALTLHGVTKTISFPADLTLTADQVDVKAEFALNRKDFGIVYPGKSDDLIRDDVLLTLELRTKG